jgi:hypothetical protein
MVTLGCAMLIFWAVVELIVFLEAEAARKEREKWYK